MDTPIYIISLDKPWNNVEYRTILSYLDESWDYNLDGFSSGTQFLDYYLHEHKQKNFALVGWHGSPVGFMGLTPNSTPELTGEGAWETKVFLHKKFRRRGIAKTLNQSLVQAIALESRIPAIWAQVAEDNLIGQAAFLRSFYIEPEKITTPKGTIARWFLPELSVARFEHANQWVVDDLRSLIVSNTQS